MDQTDQSEQILGTLDRELQSVFDTQQTPIDQSTAIINDMNAEQQVTDAIDKKDPDESNDPEYDSDSDEFEEEDEQKVREYLTEDGMRLRKLDIRWRQNRSMIVIAIRNNGEALRFASAMMRADPELCKLAANCITK